MKSQDRILTTHVGSLIRPPALVELLVRESQGEQVDPKAVRACIDSEVPKIVRRQVDAGIDIVNDGEFGKALSWTHYIAARLTGVEVRHDVMPEFTKAGPGKDRTDFAEFYAEYEEQYGPAGMGKETFGSLMRMPTAVTGPLGYRPEEVRADIARLKAAMKSSGAERGFLPVAAPVSAAATLGNAYYKSSEELMFGVAEALAVEYKEIVDSGLTVQIDDGFLAPSYDGMVPPMSLNEYRAWVNVGVEALNHALKGIPEDRVRYHVCWGSWNGPHSNDVNVRDILDLVLKVKAGGYSLEMANPRHEHEWRVWEKIRLPAGKVLYPGVVTHSTNVVEHPELVAERIVRLANLVGRENVVASTDCGFAQGPFARRVHPSIQWAKLTSLAEGARIATQELWGRKAA
jgi:5-methyltetrahydropteroyltriglutamate--homocysteine methyltransferase